MHPEYPRISRYSNNDTLVVLIYDWWVLHLKIDPAEKDICLFVT